MANRWLRGPQVPATGSDFSLYSRGMSIILYHWFTKLLEYVAVDEVTAAFSYAGSVLQNGSDGVLTNSSYRFTANSATFTSGMVGYYLCIKDTTNPANCGIYRITNFVDADNVDIDFYSPDFPIAKTNLYWWLFNASSGTTLAVNDLVVYRAPHGASPYEFSVKLYEAGSLAGLQFAFAANSGAWNTGTNDWNADAKLHGKAYLLNTGGTLGGRVYAFGDAITANFHMLMIHNEAGTNAKQFLFSGVFDPLFETNRAAAEKVFTFGGTTGGLTEYSKNGSPTTGFDLGRVISANLNPGAYPTRWLGWNNFSNDYMAYPITLPNHRSGTEYDGLPIWVVGDSDLSTFPVWALWGSLPKDYIWLGAVGGLAELTTFGSNAYIHWRGGVVTPWPGLGRS